MMNFHMKIPKLSKGGSNCLEREITLAKASKTVSNMKSNKSPGSDSFLKVFWKYIDIFVC